MEDIDVILLDFFLLCLTASSFSISSLERANSLLWFAMLAAVFVHTSSCTQELKALASYRVLHLVILSLLNNSIPSLGWTMFWIPGIFPLPMIQAHNAKSPP